ncbi:MAG TPA: transposase family protein [Clostridia bacterium]|nr:transposase family protein [Clostridia bacterium]
MTGEVWLTLDEVIEATRWTRRHVLRLDAEGLLRSREVETYSGPGRRPRKYAASSLPAEAQFRWAQRSLQAPSNETALALRPATDLQPVLFAAESVDRDPLTEEQRAEAMERYAAIALLVDWRSGKRTAVYFPGGRRVTNSNELADWLGQQHGLSASGIWKRYLKYKNEGLKGLAHTRSDYGKSRVWTKYPKAKKFLFGKFNEGLSVAHAYDELSREWSGLYNHGSVPPSYSTVLALYKSIPPVARDIGRLKQEKHDAKYAPFIITDIAKLRPNQMWVSDHRIRDIWMQDDVFACDLQPMRIWETTIEDMRSRVIRSVFCKTPSWRSIASCLRVMIEEFGLPELFYCDNGKDYRKVGAGADRIPFPIPEDLDDEGRVLASVETQGLLSRLGIAVKYCIPRHPQSKQIEAYNAYQSKRLDLMFGVAYAGNRPDRRPDACNLALKQHKEFLQGKRESSPLPLASYVIAMSNYWTDEFNATYVHHRGRGMNNRAPLEVFNELLPREQRREVNVQEIEELFWDRQKRIVANAAVQLFNASWVGVTAADSAQLYLANGTEVEIACDPLNKGEALVIKDRRPIARIQAQQLVERGPAAGPAIADMIRLRSKLRAGVKQTMRVLTAGVPTALEQMRERAGLEKPQQPPRPPIPEKIKAYAQSRAAVASTFEPAQPEDLADEVYKLCQEG